MNSKHIVKFGSMIGSSLMLLQMAPLVHASGNMSDGTGHNANPVPIGNGSDYTGSLNQVIIKLVTTSLINIRGTAVSIEIQRAFAALLIGQSDVNACVEILVQSGIERSLALSLAQSLRGLILADGTINQTQLAQVILSYRAILSSSSIELFLNPSPEFLALQAILSQLTQNQLDFAFIAPDVNVNSTLITLIRALNTGSFTTGGVAVNSQFQTVLLNLILGRVDVTTAVNVFVGIGIRADLAQALAQSFQGVIQADGSINQTQLTLVITSYQNILANSSVAFLSNPPVELLALQAILIQFGVSPTLVAINVPSTPGGGGVTPPTDNGGGNTPTTPGGTTGGGMAGKPDQPKGPGHGGNMSDATGGIITTGDIAGNLSDASGVIVTTSDIAGKPEDKPVQIKPVPVSNNNNSGSSSGNNNNGTGVIFIASYIGGPFSFANIQIKNAIRVAAKSVISQLRAQGSITIQGRVVSVESKQIVLNILIAKNDAGNGQFVSSCTRGGINGALAQNLAKSLQGLIQVDDAGEVSGVDATKLLAALGSYNAIIDSSSSQVLANRPGEVTVVQFSLSSMVKAGFTASSGNQTATTGVSE